MLASVTSCSFPGPAVIEQRKTQRFEMELPVKIVQPKTHAGVSGHTRNISSSGVLFTSPAPVQIGEVIEYVIGLPALSGSAALVELHCTGVVVRTTMGSGFAATLERHKFIRVEKQPNSEAQSLWQSATAWLSKLGGLKDGKRSTERSGEKHPKAKSAKSQS